MGSNFNNLPCFFPKAKSIWSKSSFWESIPSLDFRLSTIILRNQVSTSPDKNLQLNGISWICDKCIKSKSSQLYSRNRYNIDQPFRQQRHYHEFERNQRRWLEYIFAEFSKFGFFIVKTMRIDTERTFDYIFRGKFGRQLNRSYF